MNRWCRSHAARPHGRSRLGKMPAHRRRNREEAPALLKPTQVAMDARVASERLTVSEAMRCLEEGDSGATLRRPGLERLRAVIAAGPVDRLSVHSPDRLARQYASQVIVVEECRQAGVEVVCFHLALGRRLDDDL